jgi:hypothetical protein
MKKYIYIAIGVFVVLIIVAGFVTAKLNPSLLTTNFYEFIDKYFVQWSPALGATGTVFATIIAVTAIFESRRNQKLQMYDYYFSKIETWASESHEALNRILNMLKSVPMNMRSNKNLERQRLELMEQDGLLKSSKEIDNGKMQLNLESQIKVNEAIMDNDIKNMDYLKNQLDLIVKYQAKLSASRMFVSPIIYLLKDKTLIDVFDKYQKLETSHTNIDIENIGGSDDLIKNIELMKTELETIIACVLILRNKSINYKS